MRLRRANGQYAKIPLVERFWAKVRRGHLEECWPWTGAFDSKGRGQVSDDSRRLVTAPRAAWFMAHGDWPPSHLFVCHRCDNPACCNPAHLWLGTNRDNGRDSVAKGRHWMQKTPNRSFFATAKGRVHCSHPGSAHGNAKLTEENVEIIKAGINRGEPNRSFAKRFGVSDALISDIKRGRAWTHVPWPEQARAAILREGER